MKKCTLCQEIKSLDEFNKNKSKKYGLNNVCRNCSNTKSKKYYDLNKDYHKKKIHDRNKRIIDENRVLILNYLKTHPCIDCGNSNPIVLEFDHKDTNIKFKTVSEMLKNGYSWLAISEEIAKCDVRCANCHRIRTAKQFGWYKNK